MYMKFYFIEKVNYFLLFEYDTSKNILFFLSLPFLFDKAPPGPLDNLLPTPLGTIVRGGSGSGRGGGINGDGVCLASLDQTLPTWSTSCLIPTCSAWFSFGFSIPTCTLPLFSLAEGADVAGGGIGGDDASVGGGGDVLTSKWIDKTDVCSSCQ